ncbi:MAG TPA: hypothetical protein DCL41_06790, partial [Bdellovibrionales bacterium]|nr:hypothetical protein [Bdellovibrionales bacterium]
MDSPSKTESYLFSTLKRLGFTPEFLELDSDLDPLVERVNRSPQVHFVFNLLEELSGEAKFDFHAISYLESKGIVFSGNGPRALIVTRDKFLSKMIVREMGICVPSGKVIRRKVELKKISFPFPWFLKLNMEDASFGISQFNRVNTISEAEEVFDQLRSLSTVGIIVEEFIEGADLSFSVIGNEKPQVFPARELKFPNSKWVAGENVKFKSSLRKKEGIRSVSSKWKSQKEELQAKKKVQDIYTGLKMRGYGRLDFRRSKEGKLYFLEAN